MFESKSHVRTWIEIDKKALYNNAGQFLKLIPKNTRFMAVVKSNAYGHGLVQISKLLANYYSLSASDRLWFGVDSIVEGLRLRKEGIKNNILVLGLTLEGRLKDAYQKDIAITISSFGGLHALVKEKKWPKIHIKIDTGMHRQGFFIEDVPRIIKFLKKNKIEPEGVYTHFAAAKDIHYPTATLKQLALFKKALAIFKKAGYKNLIRHASASGGALLFPESHLDMVRVGMGLYGYFPSSEAKTVLGTGINLQPVLSWKTIVGEVKQVPAGSALGYDFSEKVSRLTKIAVLPVGYWHGFDRGLSSIGEVLIGGLRRKVLGRVSMDMIMVDVTDGEAVRAGDEAVLIGSQKNVAISAEDMAIKLATSPYEVITRINPLIYKKVK